MVKTKKGDTLIEVTIAIGIFSMIAIGVAAVMSSGTSGSQTALETTLTRAEIDAQAEALRFIHSSYISSKSQEDAESNGNANPYRTIWQKITSNAVGADSSITQFTPSTCDDLYKTNDPSDKSTLIGQKAFILNVKKLSSTSDAYVPMNNNNKSKFAITTTYPRLLFGSASNNSSNDELYNSGEGKNNLYRAEGIYVVAVKDAGTTQIVDNKTSNTGSLNEKPAFYDFYIRTCWYGTDADRPSTISTLIRLYNPDVTATRESGN
ncbi:type II secretion system protein [Candidatus Saccharibacteria bacterium]|nr:type II secretion system protein [Candidatus Saccharibacteria bacterium]MBR0488279.1 type II secretion system protein [Candidatus Saccharibacteria bacterium]